MEKATNYQLWAILADLVDSEQAEKALEELYFRATHNKWEA